MALQVFLLAILISVQRCGSVPSREAGEAKTPPATMPAVSASSSAAQGEGPRVDFQSEVQPMLQARCSPCHFPGGALYERLPFDREATIRRLGTRLFTRIQDEKDQALILRLLAQPGSMEDGDCPPASPGAPSPPTR